MSDGTTEAPSPPPFASSAGFERLDTLVRVTTIQSWVYLATIFGVSVATVAFAVFYEVPTKVTGEGILLIKQDTIAQVRAQATGRLIRLRVKPGDPVEREQAIGEISQDDLKDAIREEESRLKDLIAEDDAHSQLELVEKETHGRAMARLREATGQEQKSSREKLKIAERLKDGTDRLRMQFYSSDIELLQAREKMFDIENDVHKGDTKLAELALEGIKAESVRRRAKLDRQLKINQLERKLALDREKMTRTSQIVSRFSGTVAHVLSARDELVHEGAPVVILHSPKGERGADDDQHRVRLDRVRAGGRRQENQSEGRGRGEPDDCEAGGIRIHPGARGGRFGAARDQAGDGVSPSAPGTGRYLLETVRARCLVTGSRQAR